MKQANAAPPTVVNDTLLRNWALPPTPVDGDKEVRGHVLVLGGSAEMPGAVILAATAALRAGAGKLTIATGASVAQLVALAMPEARVIALRENQDGGFTADATAALEQLAGKVDATLIGPGMCDEPGTAALVRALLPHLGGARIVLDACAMGIILNPDLAPQQAPFRFDAPVIVTPHAGEMAHLTGIAKEQVLAEPDPHAARAAQQWHAVVALKGARTVIASPDRSLWSHEGGNIGLASSGSGDALAGIIAGLAARGATLEQAACWGIALHARAGNKLAERFGKLGYLAREIPHEIPALMENISGG